MKNINYNYEDLVDHHGITAVIKNSKEEILMQKHVKYGFWTLPVGKVKIGQSVEEGLKEEILEECNLNIEKFREIINKKYTYVRDEKKVIVDTHLFEILKYSGIMNNNEFKKHSRQEFLNLDKIKKLSYLSDTTLLYLKYLGFNREARI